MFVCSVKEFFFFAFYPVRPFWSTTLSEIFANNTSHAGAWCFSSVKINSFSCRGWKPDFALKVSSTAVYLQRSPSTVGLKCLFVSHSQHQLKSVLIAYSCTRRLAFRLLYVQSKIIFSFWIFFHLSYNSLLQFPVATKKAMPMPYRQEESKVGASSLRK